MFRTLPVQSSRQKPSVFVPVTTPIAQVEGWVPKTQNGEYIRVVFVYKRPEFFNLGYKVLEVHFVLISSGEVLKIFRTTPLPIGELSVTSKMRPIDGVVGALASSLGLSTKDFIRVVTANQPIPRRSHRIM